MTWHIVGLNALNNCEKVLFKYLKSKGQAQFYWDDAHFFMNDTDHKAGFFVRENMRMFGNDLEHNGSETITSPGWTMDYH